MVLRLLAGPPTLFTASPSSRSETEPDPAVSAFREWYHVFRTMLRYERDKPDGDVAELRR